MSVTRALVVVCLVACGRNPQTGTPDGAGDASPDGRPRTGLVRLDDHSLADDGGRFNALGATMMWAAWGYRHDRARLESELAYLRDHGFHYIRALGVVGDPVGEDFWDGREIDEQWPDYDDVIAGLTDLVYDSYGMRVEWTLIGDGQFAVPTAPERFALVDRFIAMAQSRAQKIIHFEIANEYYQNGFGGDDGLAQLRELTGYLRERTDILVAASAPFSSDCDQATAVYGGDVADLATIHFDRSMSGPAGPWQPVQAPWSYARCGGALPVASNNEPVGPGSSVTSLNDVPALVAAPLVTWTAKQPMHVFHSRAGVRGDDAFVDMAGSADQRHLMRLAPPDLSSRTRSRCGDPDAPFRCFARDGDTWIADATWPGLANPTGGAVDVVSGSAGDEHFTVAFGIRDELRLEARLPLTIDVIDPQTGETIATHAVAAGEPLQLAGREVAILVSRSARAAR